MYNNEIINEDLEFITKGIDLEKLKNKTFLVTGATGMLASYYVATLLYLNDSIQY